MKFNLTENEKYQIKRMHFKDGLPSRQIAKVVLGSETKKSTINNFLKYVRENEDIRNGQGKTYLLTDSAVKTIAKSTKENSEIAKFYEVPVLLVRAIKDGEVTEGLIPEEGPYYDRLVKKTQKQADMLRVERKVSREGSRVNNMLEELTRALIDVMDEHSLNVYTKAHCSTGKAVGIVHLSDLHFNEQIDLPHNKFNFEVASKRIMKHVSRAKHYFSGHGITDVVVCITGDTQNSNRRADEYLTNAVNRSKALFLSVDIMQQAICDLNEKFNVTVFSITGNESRVDKDLGWVKEMAQDNFDFMLHNILAHIFKDKPGVEFNSCEDSPLERVINVLGSNILLIHGHNGIASNPSTKVAQKRSQYSARGIHLDYIIMGHIHEALIADTYARSSGLPGANGYSENALNLTSRASQNLYIFFEDKSHDCIKVDLQNVDGIVGYNINMALAGEIVPDPTVVKRSNQTVKVVY